MEEEKIFEYIASEDKIGEANKPIEIMYDTAKDFYKGIRGELRFKAEGLFKKAREKGISIEDVEIELVKENHVEFPGIGNVDLPTYIVKVKGMILENQQVMVDGKQLNFYNRYQKYIISKIEEKNLIKNERGKNGSVDKNSIISEKLDFNLSDWDKFQIGKAIIEDKEFGIEKTITGACDRVIRKLMGENDWLYPGEARLLEEEFNEVDKKAAGRETQRFDGVSVKKASEKQINYLKNKIKNAGLNAEDQKIIAMIIEQAGLENKTLEQLNMSEMSRLIDTVNDVVPLIKERLN